MDLIEEIGPYLGIVAFAGLALLAFLVIQQAREVRRLREWAGRAPERADEAAEAAQAAAEARGQAPAPASEDGSGRIAAVRDRIVEALRPGWQELDRRSPVDLRYVAALLAAAALGAGALTSGFGVIGGEGKSTRSSRGGGERREREPPAEVAVLNGTQVAGVQGVPGLAAKVVTQVVEPAGYRAGPTSDAPTSFPETVVMYEQGEEAAGRKLAADVEQALGVTSAQAITPEVRQLVQGATLVIVLGQDDAEF